MSAVLWVGIVTAGWLTLSVAAGLLLALGAHLQRSLVPAPRSAAPSALNEAHRPRPPLRLVPSLPRQRSAVDSSDVSRVVR
jgi:hypothetical protein